MLPFQSRHFNLNLHARVSQSRCNHHRRRSHLAKVLSKHWPAGFKISRLWQNIGHANNILQARARLLQRRGDVFQTLFGLHHHIVRNRHRPIVKPRRARDKHPIPRNHRTGIADLGFKCRAGADEGTFHDISKNYIQTKFCYEYNSY